MSSTTNRGIFDPSLPIPGMFDNQGIFDSDLKGESSREDLTVFVHGTGDITTLNHGTEEITVTGG